MMLIILCGLPVTSKSTTANHLALDLRGTILRTDIIRRELFEESNLEEVLNSNDPMHYDLERIFDAQESIPNKYQEMIWKQKKMVYNALFQSIRLLLLKGQTVILDGTFYQKNLRETVYQIARKTNTPVFLIECFSDEAYIIERLARRKEVSDETSNVDKWHIYQQVKDNYEKPTEKSDPVPTIRYDTGAQWITTHNADSSDKMIRLLVNSLTTLMGRFT